MLKRELLEHLRSLSHEVIDVGSHDDRPVDFPDIARSLTAKVTSGDAQRGLMVCGTGVGAAFALPSAMMSTLPISASSTTT